MIDLRLLEKLEQTLRQISDRELQDYFRKTTAQFKSDGSIVTEADLRMQEQLRLSLQALAPGIELLGEEMEETRQREIMASADAYWCIDPLDGTNNFHHGVPLFAVSVGLVVEQQLALGLVYDPVREEMFSALKGGGLRVDSLPSIRSPQPATLSKCLASVDFKRLRHPMKEKLLTRMPFKSQRNAGSCALEWAWLAAGRVQLLLHGGEKFWDYAAGCLLVDESSGFSCSGRNEPVFNNSLENRQVIAATTSELFAEWQRFLLD